MKKYLLTIIIMVLVPVSSLLLGAIPSGERAALIALYNSAGGANWNDNSGWKTAPLASDGFAMPGSEGNWHGITVTNDYVTRIDLNHNNLRGTIPTLLGNLSHVTYLLLGYNLLTGTLPAQLGNMTALEVLLVTQNELKGSIPASLGNLKNLNRLYMEFNNFSGSIPAELGNIPKLDHLWLHSNELTGSIPASLGNLKKMTWLMLSSNRLSGTIPPELGYAEYLCYLNLGSNQLQGEIPETLGNLKNIIWLSLQYNQLEGSIPASLGNLHNLAGLYLNLNQLSGSIPATFANLSALSELRVGHNQLSGTIPAELGSLPNLAYIDFNDNQLIGSIPSSIATIASLESVSMEDNLLSGEIPENFMHLPKLRYCSFKQNCLTASAELSTWLKQFELNWEATQCLEKNAPFGQFDTPVDGATVSGSIAVTGWALDDRKVASVKIYREENGTLIYIGTATSIDGARLDVAAQYPGYPNCTSAGWGYMLLTNFLPNNGNGTFVLHAIITDKAGKTTDLGSKTIHVNNAEAVKPFGALDTPTQSNATYCTSLVNWGWVLTPQPNAIPTNGSTIDVWVDGVKLGHPTYNLYREDIATLFPTYANSNGAVGYFTIDLTPYSAGLHTIQWTATDNAGNTDGIGSRYFTIGSIWCDQNANDVATMLPRNFSEHQEAREKSRNALTEQFDMNSLFTVNELQAMTEDSAPAVYVIKEMEHLEIPLSFNGAELVGYVMGPKGLMPLPVGSTLDNTTGTFYWSPGPGFLGQYNLVFVFTENNGQTFKKNVTIDIQPKF